MWRQWRRTTALARCELLTLSDASLQTQALRYLPAAGSSAAVDTAVGGAAAVTAVPPAVAAEEAAREGRFLASLLRLVDDPYLANDPDGRAAATALACRLLSARQGRLEAAKVAEKGSAAAQLQAALAAVDGRLQAQQEELVGAVAAARRGAAEALDGYREQVARQLREAAVTADSKLASSNHRLAAVDTSLGDVRAAAGRAEAAASTAASRLQKLLLEHGDQAMRVAGLEQVPCPYPASTWPLSSPNLAST